MLLAVVVLASLSVVTAQESYTTKFDNVDIDSILQNDRLIKNYFNCLMDKGPCTPDGKELKKNLPEALENDCAKCSEKQKAGAKKVLKYIYEHKQENLYKELEAKYDPEHKYRQRYEKRIEELEGKQ